MLHWCLLAFGALIMGMSKGGLPGAGNLTVAIYALVLEDALVSGGVALSVGLLLPVLISADVTATVVYRRHADWKFIFRLLPFFLVGTVVGWLVFDFFQGGDDRIRLLKYVIGGILLGMTILHFAVKYRKKSNPSADRGNSVSSSKGSTAMGINMTAGSGYYYIVGYGEEIRVLAVDVIISEKTIVGNLVGTWSELYELMELANKGLVTLSMQEYKLGDANKALHDLNEGKVKGRAVLVP